MENMRKCTTADFPALVDVWERSVRSTHSFLTEENIVEIRGKLARVYFPEVNLHCIETDSVIAGFIGMSGNMVEMLFIDPAYQGRGYGTALFDKAKANGCHRVDVNEQNPAALEFYRHRGFEIIGRSETDDAGRPFPILHLELKNCH